MIKDCIRRQWEKNMAKSIEKPWHKMLFPSYWHSIIYRKAKTSNHINYFTARPNPSAGIGHQIANWHSGYWWSQCFGLHFAHSSFSQKSWERFLGYGEKFPRVDELKNNSYKIVRIPRFSEYKLDEIDLTRRIIDSYRDSKVVFIAEQDQPYHDQIDVIPVIREKFFSSPVRRSDLTPFDNANFNIAVHVRRGDITIGQTNGDPNLLMRWLDNEYFEKVLEQVLSVIKTDKEVHIYIFSQGDYEAFKSFERFPNVHIYLDLNPESTFLSFVYANLLITSKSSFSYKPALLNINGKKVCPRNFWHSYPDDKDWILANESGLIPENELIKLIQ